MTPRDVAERLFASCLDAQCTDATSKHRCAYRQGVDDALDVYEEALRDGAVDRVLATFRRSMIAPEAASWPELARDAVDAILGPVT